MGSRNSTCLQRRARACATKDRIDTKHFFGQYEPMRTGVLREVVLKCRHCGIPERVTIAAPPDVVIRRVEKITCKVCVRSGKLVSKSTDRRRNAKAAMDRMLGLSPLEPLPLAASA